MSKPVDRVIGSLSNAPIGIDFGTTNSAMSRYVVSRLRQGPESLNFPLTGAVLYPSAALIDEEHGHILTGLTAYKKRHITPENVVMSVKRDLSEPSFRIINGKHFTNPDIASAIITGFIEEYKTTDPEFHPNLVVATVPYYFGGNENALIKQSVQTALDRSVGTGVKVILLPEPVAATLACIYQMQTAIDAKMFLVYDIGGGTLDVTLVKVTKNEKDFRYEVLANEGIARFGGDDIDQLLYEYIVKQEQLDYATLPSRQQIINKAKLLSTAQEVKEQLSHVEEDAFLCAGLYGNRSIVERVVTRESLNAIISGKLGGGRNMLDEFSNCISRLYAKCCKLPEMVDYVIPVGGSSMIPLFREYVNHLHTNAEIVDQPSNNNMVMVANGAAIYAAIKSDEMMGTTFRPFGGINVSERMVTKISHSLYLQKYDGTLDLLIPANSVSPTSIEKIYYPSKMSRDGSVVELDKVALFQGVGDSRKNGHCIGHIDFSGCDIYTHGRPHKEIPVRMIIEASDTLVTVECHIAKSDLNRKDIHFKQVITNV